MGMSNWFKKSEKLSALLEPHDLGELMDTLDGAYYSTCTTGYDNDGSTGFEIFGNGVALGAAAGKSDIFCYSDEGIALFFLGEEEDIVAEVKKMLEEAYGDDDE